MATVWLIGRSVWAFFMLLGVFAEELWVVKLLLFLSFLVVVPGRGYIFDAVGIHLEDHFSRFLIALLSLALFTAALVRMPDTAEPGAETINPIEQTYPGSHTLPSRGARR